MKGRFGLAPACLVLLSSACAEREAPARPEWLVSVSTDVPVPQLGDRLLVEVLSEDGELACTQCRRVLAAGSAEDFPISFSVVPSAKASLLRTRLYRSELAGADGLPAGTLLIDHVGRLPSTTGKLALSVGLRLACLGVAADVGQGQSCSPERGALAPVDDLPAGDADPLVPGTAALSLSEPCTEPLPAGMRCVPGGLFVLGDATALATSKDNSPRPERLTRLSPFFLDEHEMSVGQVRALVDRLTEAPVPRGASGTLARQCTYLGPREPSADDQPLNCVSLATAREVCALLGKRLPTEAEWEYAAGNTTRETAYPWGDDPNICSHAVVARAQTTLDTPGDANPACLSQAGLEPLGGPLSEGHELDVTDQGIRNLAGNVAEFVADAFESFSGECWSIDGVLDNPRCDETARTDFPVALRGSSWTGMLATAAATSRNGAEGGGPIPNVGFRCAQDAR